MTRRDDCMTVPRAFRAVEGSHGSAAIRSVPCPPIGIRGQVNFLGAEKPRSS